MTKINNCTAGLFAAAFATNLFASAGNLSFNPTSYKMWIASIVLQNDSGLSNEFYTCNSSAADCEIDLASTTSIQAFESKLGTKSITEGTYNKVWINCTPDMAAKNGYIKIKGSAKLASGTTWYTADAPANGGSPWIADATKNGETKISMGSCGSTYYLPTPLVVSKDKPVTVTLLSNTYMTAYYNATTSGGLGGCVTSGNGQPGLCMVYPSVFAYFGETSPTVEMYSIATHTADASAKLVTDSTAIVKMIFDASGGYFFSSFGAYYGSETSVPDTDRNIGGWANSITATSKNANGTFSIKSIAYGFDSFQRVDGSTGTLSAEKVVNGAGSGQPGSFFYKAFRHTPTP